MKNHIESGKQIKDRMATAPKTSEQPLVRQRKMPDWICHECGIKYCNGTTKRYATYHIGICECCGAEEVPCTEPRDYGHFTQWPLPRDVDPRPIPMELSELVEPIIEQFDFDTLHKAMTAVRWQWFDGQGPEKVPTVEQLRSKSRDLLLAVAYSKKNVFQQGTGGLYATKHDAFEHEDQGLELRFEFERAEAYFGDYE